MLACLLGQITLEGSLRLDQESLGTLRLEIMLLGSYRDSKYAEYRGGETGELTMG